MSRTIRNKKAVGVDTWKRESKAAGIWYFPVDKSSDKKHVKKMTNKYLRRKFKNEDKTNV